MPDPIREKTPDSAPGLDQDQRPIDMVLFCPKCGLQHIDAPDPGANVSHEELRRHGAMSMGPGDVVGWTNPPHRSHLCHGCGHIWRPADVPTNGVAAITTKGKADSDPVNPGDVLQSSEARAVRAERERDEALSHLAAKNALFRESYQLGSEWRTRAEAAESQLASLKERVEGVLRDAVSILEPFARYGDGEDADLIPDECVISLTYDSTTFDEELGGPNTLLGEPFMRRFRKARDFFVSRELVAALASLNAAGGEGK